MKNFIIFRLAQNRDVIGLNCYLKLPTFASEGFYTPYTRVEDILALFSFDSLIFEYRHLKPSCSTPQTRQLGYKTVDIQNGHSRHFKTLPSVRSNPTNNLRSISLNRTHSCKGYGERISYTQDISWTHLQLKQCHPLYESSDSHFLRNFPQNRLVFTQISSISSNPCFSKSVKMSSGVAIR